MRSSTTASQASMRTGHTGLARRAGWGLADQALSSLTNFALVIVVARESTPHTLGIFALAFATYGLALGSCRAICSEPLVVRYSNVTASAWRSGTSLATGNSLMVGLIVGSTSAVVGALVGGEARSLFLILGLILPGVLLQDTWRYAFVAAKRTPNAFANDLVYALLLLPALLGLLASNQFDVPRALLLWGGAATVAAFVGAGQARLLPAPRRIFAWLSRQSDLAPRYLGEFAAVAGESQVVLYGVALILGVTAVAAIRGGFLLLGPLNVLVFSATMAGVPEAVRLLKHGTPRLIAACLIISCGLVTLTGVWMAALLSIPTSVGTSTVGVIWDTARPLIVPLSISTAALGAVIGAAIGLRALEAAPTGLRARLIASPVVLLAGCAGAAVHGAAGAAWGLATGQTIAAIVFWLYFMRAVGERQFTTDARSVPRHIRLESLEVAVEHGSRQ
jgi:O-antigen/teichoic acid export membrane protein